MPAVQKVACTAFELAQDLGMPGGMLKHLKYTEPLEAIIGMFSMPFICIGVNAGRYERQRSTTKWSTSAVNIR